MPTMQTLRNPVVLHLGPTTEPEKLGYSQRMDLQWRGQLISLEKVGGSEMPGMKLDGTALDGK